MPGTTCGPIAEHWTGIDGGAAGARPLANAVASLDLSALEPWRDELAQAVDELARSAGSPLRWDAGDPVVALLRAVAALARSAPDACSTTAAGLIAVLGAGADRSVQLAGNGTRRGCV